MSLYTVYILSDNAKKKNNNVYKFKLRICHEDVTYYNLMFVKIFFSSITSNDSQIKYKLLREKRFERK